MLKKISITGPESTGKTTLAKYLAKHFNEPYVPEYARQYLNDKGTDYTLTDVLNIAKGQLNSENTIAKQAKNLLFCDTDILVTKIWCEVVFKETPQWITDNFLKHRYHLYLLCYPDIQWQPDPLRQNPNDRDKLFELYKSALLQNNMPFKIITGTGIERAEKAVNFVKQII